MPSAATAQTAKALKATAQWRGQCEALQGQSGSWPSASQFQTSKPTLNCSAGREPARNGFMEMESIACLVLSNNFPSFLILRFGWR